MGNRIWVEAAIGPAAFAVLAVFNALTGRGMTWRRRAAVLLQDLRDCVVAALVLGGVAALLHGLGVEGAADVACVPSPNGRICEDE